MKKRDKLIGVRLDPDTYEELEFFSGEKKSTKMEFIRLAIESYLEEARNAFEDEAIQDFINLRIDEEEYLKFTEKKKVPRDIQEARKRRLEEISQEKQ
jgi:predicted DNA-binding protein